MQMNEEVRSEKRLEDITGMTCIYVPVSDVFEAVHWYQKNLGCVPTHNNPVAPGMKHAIMRFPDRHGNTEGAAGLRCTVPALFLVESQERVGFTNYHEGGQPFGCFTTPRIQEMFDRFGENGVRVLGDIPFGRECGPNFQFLDLDGNLWEIWQP